MICITTHSIDIRHEVLRLSVVLAAGVGACVIIFYLVGLDCIVLPIAFGDALASAHLSLDCYSKKDIIKEQFIQEGLIIHHVEHLE